MKGKDSNSKSWPSASSIAISEGVAFMVMSLVSSRRCDLRTIWRCVVNSPASTKVRGLAAGCLGQLGYVAWSAIGHSQVWYSVLLRTLN